MKRGIRKYTLLIVEFAFKFLSKSKILTVLLHLHYIICIPGVLLMGNIKMSTIVSIKGL